MAFRRIGLLLPGQGSQHVGMGMPLARTHAHVRELYEQANDLLGVDLARISWEGPEEELRQTENAQPAILVHSYAVWTCLPTEVQRRVVVGAGHSLGEFSAYLAAGALGFGDAVRLVRRRGELMARAGAERQGTMAAIIGLDSEALQAVCDEVESGTVVPANFNAPGQIVISGDAAAIAKARTLALAAGAKRAIPLNVSGAFHSPLMERARDGLAREIEDVRISDPAFPVVANASASPVGRATEAARLLMAQLTAPVRWVECVETMRTQSPDLWLEAGPGRVLAGLMRRIDRTQPSRAVGDPEDLASFMEECDA